jgi:hypothetical protein
MKHSFIGKENLMNKLLRKFLLVILAFLAIACGQGGLHWSAVPLFSVAPLLEPEDKIDTMVITTGAEAATPLWRFCSPTIKNDHLITADCGDVSSSKLAIGHTFGVMDLVSEGSDWSDLKWELYLDGHRIDLNAFGTYSFVHPDLALNPAPISQEVFRSVRVWNVILENPTAGPHVVYGHVHSGNETYTWIVNFIVTATERHFIIT